MPLLVAALFWKGSTKWGALAAGVWTAVAVAAVAVVQSNVPAPPAGTLVPIVTVGGYDAVVRASTGTLVFGFLPVVPMTIGSSALIVIVSLLTRAARPAPATLAKYFRA
jgi:Na+/proline symporter